MPALCPLACVHRVQTAFFVRGMLRCQEASRATRMSIICLIQCPVSQSMSGLQTALVGACLSINRAPTETGNPFIAGGVRHSI